MDPLKFAVVWLKSHFRRGTAPARNPPGGVVRVGAGLEPVSASTVNEIVSSVTDPLLTSAGFHSLRTRRWVRSLAPVRHIFEIVPMKGASYVPTWGISLDFVPHISGGKLAWHRTEKSARMDLVYDPVDFDASWRERACIGSFHGPEGTLSDAQRVLTAAIQHGECATIAIVSGVIVEVSARKISVPFQCPCCGNERPDGDFVASYTRRTGKRVIHETTRGFTSHIARHACRSSDSGSRPMGSRRESSSLGSFWPSSSESQRAAWPDLRSSERPFRLH